MQSLFYKWAGLNTPMAISPGKTMNSIFSSLLILMTLFGIVRGIPSQENETEISPVDNEKVSFRNEVLPVFAKLGCNSGACHGALAGKGGFRLSLRGFDPGADYFNIVKQARGRRIELRDPAKSLLLTKPSGAVSHKGGVRFNVNSPAYKILSTWIAQGAIGPTNADLAITKVQILPGTITSRPGDRQMVKVQAIYSDGSTKDVTRWSKFTSTDETIAKVSEKGEIEVNGFGVGAITAWFDSRIAVASLTIPYANRISPEVFQETPKRNFIDARVIEQLRQLRLQPSPRCDDSTFVRRVFLDAIGILPKPDEVKEFLDDSSPDKRDKLIDALLNRPEFVDLWTYHWSDLLLINGTRLRPNAVKSFYQWVRKHVQNNTPWDRFVHEILTAQGSSLKNGATNFYALHQDPQNMAENASQAFLGLSIACAKCHNHPLEKWTNDQYYAFANMFSRVRAKGWGGDGRNGDGKRTLFLATSGELIQPGSGKPQPPSPLDGVPLSFDYQGDRRVPLADWLVDRKNPYFAKAITNRVWAKFFAVGLVDPVDDLRLSNPARNAPLLEEAATFLADHDFDLKALMRVIMRSETYQRSSTAVPGNQLENRYYSRYYPKQLMAEILLDAISETTGVPTEFNQISFPGADNQKTDFYPKGTRALQLYDSAVASYFLKTFGRNQREITCECERTNESSMVQVLHIANGNTLNRKLVEKENRIGKLLESDFTDEDLIRQSYLICLAREPSRKKLDALLLMFAESKDDKRVLLEDLFWSLISSREFMFNH
ncbi:MAG: DUF1549 and DUF1553 domain-containing protein [Pirellulaceae bacterium]|nr:DUF1549 and DUF1553 domain-containing protein [Pirellulaceae bacterium]